MTITLGQIYHSYVIGRVRFVVTDLRSERSPDGNTDNAAKTMMGATQKAWFKNEMVLAQAGGQLVVWVCTVPWIAPPGDNSSDDWGGYTTERTELTTYLTGLGMQNQMLIVTGDMHSAAMDDGTNSSGFKLLHPFPENQTSQVYGGTYSQGPIQHTGTRLMGYGGVLQFTDLPTGIVVNMSVINEQGVQLTQQAFYPLAAGTDVTAAGQLWYSLHPLHYSAYDIGVNFACVASENFPVIASALAPIALPHDSGYSGAP